MAVTTITCSKCQCIHASDETHMCPDGASSIEPYPDITVVESAERAMELWPTLDSAWGCIDCKAIFRALDTKAVVSDGVGRCPRCASESCFDVAAIVNRPSISVERLRPIVELLESELALASEGRDG